MKSPWDRINALLLDFANVKLAVVSRDQPGTLEQLTVTWGSWSNGQAIRAEQVVGQVRVLAKGHFHLYLYGGSKYPSPVVFDVALRSTDHGR